MNYRLEIAEHSDIEKLKEYKCDSIFPYAGEANKDDIKRVKEYVNENVPKQLKDYKIICLGKQKIGAILYYPKDDGILLDEIYIEKPYRSKGIGSSLIKKILSENDIVYLWAYKDNKNAIKLYESLNFKVVEETEYRIRMKYTKGSTNMIHNMQLHDDPFMKIKNGTKTIEMRLNDEKRQLIKVGDIIEFTNRVTEEKIQTRVKNLYRFQSFEKLYRNFDKITLGYKENEDANPIDMEKYYSKEEQSKYGVLAIEIEVHK